jgi:hypothetical protein
MSQDNEIVVGDLVKWFEVYADMDIVRDTGSGTVFKTQKVTNPYDPYGTIRYRVFCHKLGDTRWFVKPYIEKHTTGE